MILIVNSARDLIVWLIAVHAATLALLLVAGLPAALNLLAVPAVGASFLRSCRRARRLPAIRRAVLDSQGRWRLYEGPGGACYEARQAGPAAMAGAWAVLVLELAPGRVPVLLTRRRAGVTALRRLQIRLRHAARESVD